jgi:hypothetical protein
MTSSTDLLTMIIPRLWKRETNQDPMLALEVTDGPYKGVIFAYTRFDVMHTSPSFDGLVPTRFETEVLHEPRGFVKDETFDLFTSEVLFAWLSYISTHDVNGMMRVPTVPGIH